ncbi:MAG: hypothetical protein COY38_01630 [Candidatus Aenigmarchaeota archaeon CG_4_10_14_0_8_um_filter_37_24]|nr:hypothetical protein [Candidatus Aenigmarchaeota archaeon]PIZ35790.1 MAG: hypothetical protein COY38_01630 [Candidatus Aenigmarchaeota archaeon CG_4_10_14_0_8_um_filter_37_24]
MMHRLDLVGFDRFDVDTVEEVKEKMKPLINKYDQMFDTDTIQAFRLSVKTTKKDGGKDLHELTMLLNTTLGDFRVRKDGWEILSLVDEMESVLERQIKEKKERIIKDRKGRNA